MQGLVIITGKEQKMAPDVVIEQLIVSNNFKHKKTRQMSGFLLTAKIILQQQRCLMLQILHREVGNGLRDRRLYVMDRLKDELRF